MKVLIGCETSGIVRDAFLARGYDAWSCDLLPADTPTNRHIQGDVRDVMQDDWDLMAVMHPPCTRLTNSGVRWLHTPPPRYLDTSSTVNPKKCTRFWIRSWTWRWPQCSERRRHPNEPHHPRNHRRHRPADLCRGRPGCGLQEARGVEVMETLPHPIQPLEEDEHGVIRFKSNAIVQHLLENGGINLNQIARMDFSREDREQFAQLIGYSWSGACNLGYMTDEVLDAAAARHKSGASESECRAAVLRTQIEQAKNSMREGVAQLFGVHPDDLRN